MPQADNTQVTRESIERDHPSLFAQLRTEFRAEGAATETNRVKAVLAEGEGMKGHQALVMRLALDGTTSGAQAAQAILAAERAATAGARAAHEGDAPAAAPAAAAPAQDAPKTREQQRDEAKAYANKNNVSFAQACAQLGITA